jgi:hypothetical protein
VSVIELSCNLPATFLPIDRKVGVGFLLPSSSQKPASTTRTISPWPIKLINTAPPTGASAAKFQSSHPDHPAGSWAAAADAQLETPGSGD